MRTTIDSLRTRLAGLEAMLGTVLGTPQAMSAQTGLVTPPETAYGAPHAVPAFPAQESSLPYRNDTGLASSHAYPSYRPGPSPMPTAITSPSAESSSGLLPQRFAVATAHHASSGRSDSYDASPPPFSSHYPLPQLLSNSSTAAEPQEVVFPDSGRKSPSLNHGFDTPESDPSCRLSHLRPELRKEEVAASLSLEWMVRPDPFASPTSTRYLTHPLTASPSGPRSYRWLNTLGAVVASGHGAYSSSIDD